VSTPPLGGACSQNRDSQGETQIGPKSSHNEPD
jgi:hypothetical protein